MVQQKRKKKKKTTKKTPVKTTETSSRSKKYLPYVGILVVLLVVFYLLFWPSLSTGFKKKHLKKLNVILITLDTLRVDFVSAYGKGMANTPHMDRVAEEGVLFETCIAQTPLTLPSHTTILSGTYPLYHQVRDNGGFLVPESLELISETLQNQGFETSAFIAAYVLHNQWGINQGFDTYADDFDLSKYERISLGSVQKRAEEVLADAKQWLKAHKNDKFFTWIHLYDPHTPYDPPSPFKEKFPKRPYRGEVEYMDHQLGLFFRFLKAEGLYDRSLIILVSDHGEALGQHGERTHGFFIYEPTVQVPLIIRAPFGFPVKKVKNVVELVDLAPTILEALDIPLPSFYQGKSLLGLMFGKDRKRRDVAYTETYFTRLHFGWSELKALYYDNRWKYILAPKDELYDLEADNQEKENLSLKKSYESRKAKDRMARFIREKSQDAKTPGDIKHLDKEDMQRLAALGYLTTVVDTSGKTDLPDPKGKVHVFNNLTRSKEFMANKEFDKAIEVLKKILETDPNIVDGILQLGNVYARKQMYEEALKYYYEVLNQKPDYNAAMINVVGSLRRLGRYDKGIEEAKRFLKTFPNDHTIYNEMGDLYIAKEKYDKALEIFNISLGIEKVNPKALHEIGVVYIIRKDFQQAKTFLDRVLEINPDFRKLHFHLAQVEEAKGDVDKAIGHYKKELDNHPKDFKAAYNLAEILVKRREYEEAVKYYRQAIDSNPKFNIPYFMVAKYYMDRWENIEEAVELCKKGIEIEPENKYTVFGYYILSDIYSRKGEKSTSNSYYSKGEALKQQLIKKNRWD
ncbi:MAG: sulfatase-like hydrolase/transferase [Candidatus Aminicenantes bacterium]|nr:sulfatase-like hydrolase/transferase [Candidatus Aminicenantes bacterium]NIM81216.1 sulfatase-like hydrolase/transferase [Candidatus Aminicenantes bacterium]NIN20591.1 sulfatase-like hydrolase/transferase [Candidatus Aminicenantes bacterium]NIN44370.1 sulfatase-like hydrolase/transferase [Candidatus Aminicenantes bacterium]NIN87189.1 sulfatase-like hydrolase/transferase [Candidatus Aminicenantes bacterium]